VKQKWLEQHDTAALHSHDDCNEALLARMTVKDYEPTTKPVAA
jgi:hypothetical protein